MAGIVTCGECGKKVDLDQTKDNINKPGYTCFKCLKMMAKKV